MQVSHFSLLGASTLEAVRAAAARAVDTWCAQWGIDSAAPKLVCERADPGLAGVAWDQCWNAGASHVWLACPDPLQQAVQHAMFGADASLVGRSLAPAQLAPLAVARALDALVPALSGALLSESGAASAMLTPPPGRILARGAGTLLLTVHIGAASLRCLLDSAAVARFMPAPAARRAALAPVNLWQALAATSVHLPVRLGQAEVGLGALMSVAVGDVIRLDCAVDAPVDVLAPHGAALFRAYLGQTQGSVAVEIDSRHS